MPQEDVPYAIPDKLLSKSFFKILVGVPKKDQYDGLWQSWYIADLYWVSTCFVYGGELELLLLEAAFQLPTMPGISNESHKQLVGKQLFQQYITEDSQSYTLEEQ